MKKWMIVFLVSALVIAALFYMVIPQTIIIQKSVVIKVSPQAIRRLLIETRMWNKGWPGNTTTMKDTSQSVSFNGNSYSVFDRKYSSILLSIHRGFETIATSSLNIIAISKDSVKLDWEAFMPTSNNPVKRLMIYQESKKIENDLNVLLNKMGSFFSKTANVYGINIIQQAVVDSTLLSTYDSSKGYPNVGFIYSLIGKLKKYIAIEHANVTGYPMLNIYTKDSIIYLVKVALPVDKKLPANGKLAYKWMLPGGNILVTDVRGDSKAVDRAFKQMEYFIKDYGRDAPAIPFLSLVTDRMQEKDSAKWVTRIYYPVME